MKKDKVLILGKRKKTDTVPPNISRATAPQEKPKMQQASKPIKGKGKNVLIVEDDDFLRGLLAHNMSDVGFNVRSARDAEIAFKLLRMHKPEIILLDLILPGMNGFDFLQEIKKNMNIEIPVVVLSNLGRQEDIDTARSLGAVDFLIKANVTPAQIIEKVEETLSSGS